MSEQISFSEKFTELDCRIDDLENQLHGQNDENEHFEKELHEKIETKTKEIVEQNWKLKEEFDERCKTLEGQFQAQDLDSRELAESIISLFKAQLESNKEITAIREQQDQLKSQLKDVSLISLLIYLFYLKDEI